MVTRERSTRGGLLMLQQRAMIVAGSSSRRRQQLCCTSQVCLDLRRFLLIADEFAQGLNFDVLSADVHLKGEQGRVSIFVGPENVGLYKDQQDTSWASAFKVSTASLPMPYGQYELPRIVSDKSFVLMTSLFPGTRCLCQLCALQTRCSLSFTPT